MFATLSPNVSAHIRAEYLPIPENILAESAAMRGMTLQQWISDALDRGIIIYVQGEYYSPECVMYALHGLAAKYL